MPLRRASTRHGAAVHQAPTRAIAPRARCQADHRGFRFAALGLGATRVGIAPLHCLRIQPESERSSAAAASTHAACSSTVIRSVTVTFFCAAGICMACVSQRPTRWTRSALWVPRGHRSGSRPLTTRPRRRSSAPGISFELARFTATPVAPSHRGRGSPRPRTLRAA